ncbi:MAG TPA: phosphatase [Bacteroidia bacterium]|jgi:exopolyphosphatase/guanosine-5'-triphosphate,3'-diphosphate pyrophosphatase|nr:phosphatase [Bacteroidia bacterium]
MIIAVIDLGTNTFNLLVAEVTGDHKFKSLYNEKLPVKLGEGGINQGLIADPAFLRGIEALEYYSRKIKEYKADKVMAFATSAVRNASNGKEFVDTIKNRTGFEINVISGDKEAELIAKGVSLAVKMNDHPSLVIDIGGGSTEFIIVNKEKIFWKQSFEIGASRLLQKFNPSDPIKEDEKILMSDYLSVILEPLWAAAKKYNVKELIGASGSFESLANIVQARYHNIPDLATATECTFDMEQCKIIHKELLSSTRAQRFNMRGLIAMRVDLIVVSAILVETVVLQLGITTMKYSSYALKEGVISELL